MANTEPASGGSNPLTSGTPKTLLPQPCVLVIFGAAGDLSWRKLLPAIYNLNVDGLLPSSFAVVGFGVGSKGTPDDWLRQRARDGIEHFSRQPLDEGHWADFSRRLFYVEGKFDDPASYETLKAKLADVDQQFGIPGARIFYLSIPPQFIEMSVEHLKEAGMVLGPDETTSFTRVIVEKPIGHDLASAREINDAVAQAFEEKQTYRIDHYLGKETVQNLLVLRFANSIFEPLWNQKYIDHVQITVAEEEGLTQYDPETGEAKASRIGYYEGVGALRDMVQNHLLQVLCMTAMEPPWSLEPDVVRDAKAVALRCLRPLTPEDVETSVVRAQYVRGEIDGVPVPDYAREVVDFFSKRDQPVPNPITTETFVALRVFIDNWRWSGVPFYLRTGKRLPKRTSEVAIQFKDVPNVLFNQHPEVPIEPTVLSLQIQPEEGLSLKISSKLPGPKVRIYPVKMNFNYGTSFGGSTPEAYERLLLDVMAGDATLFMRRDAVEAAWAFVMPILDHWDQSQARFIPEYEAGTWGPEEADRLIEADGRQWRTSEMTTLEASEIRPPIETGTEVPLSRVDAELTRQLKAARADLHSPVQLVRMSNLIVYCSCADHLCRAETAIPAIVEGHPARVILLLADPEATPQEIQATVVLRNVGQKSGLVTEQVTLKGSGTSDNRLPFAVRKLLIGDLPTNLWWACSTPPPLAGPILNGLAEHAQQVVFDSLGWINPIVGVASSSSWLEKFERSVGQGGGWRIASDLNWRRLKVWRRLLSQALDPSTSPGLLTDIREVVIEHGPHAVTQAWEIAGWLASRLGWTFESGKLQPNVEIAFQFRAPQGGVALKIDRLSEGPSSIRRIRVVGRQTGALEFLDEGGDRLSVRPEGAETLARTVASQPLSIAGLIARQLSDREPDPIFRESLKVAQQLAGQVVG